MKRKTILLSAVGLFAAGLLSGCSNQRSLIEDPSISLNYLLNPTEDNLSNLSKAYGTAINRNRKSGVKQPGLCSEYAITLAMMGNQEEANKWFNKEVADFPASRDYVLALKRVYCPAFESDYTQASEASVMADNTAASGKEGEAVKAVIDENNAQMAGKQDRTNVKQKNGTDKPKGKKGKKGKKSKKGKKGKKSSKK